MAANAKRTPIDTLMSVTNFKLDLGIWHFHKWYHLGCIYDTKYGTIHAIIYASIYANIYASAQCVRADLRSPLVLGRPD